MKSLKEYIIESSNSSDSKTFIFKFKDFENAEETVKSLANLEGCEVDEEAQTAKITVSKNNANKLEAIQDILQQFAQGIRGSQKRSSDEQYAQKTKAFEDEVNDFTAAIDSFLNADADPRDDVKKEENAAKEDDKKEDDEKDDDNKE